jgi:hypothetical protein
MIVKLKSDRWSRIGKLYSLSLNKEYVAELVGRKTGDWYKIKCDDGHIREFSTNYFITIEEMRDKKLKDLGL